MGRDCFTGAVPVIETTTFRLRKGVDEAAFRAADERMQTDFAYQQPGLLRRTTGRRSGGDEWIVIELWGSTDEAEVAAARGDGDPTVAAFVGMVDAASVDRRRYVTLD